MKLTKILSEHKKTVLALAIVWTAVVTYFCLATFDELPKVDINDFDKLGHIIFHYGITLLWFLFFKYNKGNSDRTAFFRSFLFSLVYGSAIEVLQATFTTTRKGDIFDVFANTIGSLLAIVTLSLLFKMVKKPNEGKEIITK